MLYWREILNRRLHKEEGYENFPYSCTKGKTTIGVGHNLTDRGLSSRIIDLILEEDVDQAHEDATAWLGEDTFNRLTDVRKLVVVDMSFQLGLTSLRKFKNTRKAIIEENWSKAKEEMLDSVWYREDTPDRAAALAELMERGYFE